MCDRPPGLSWFLRNVGCRGESGGTNRRNHGAVNLATGCWVVAVVVLHIQVTHLFHAERAIGDHAGKGSWTFARASSAEDRGCRARGDRCARRRDVAGQSVTYMPSSNRLGPVIGKTTRTRWVVGFPACPTKPGPRSDWWRDRSDRSSRTCPRRIRPSNPRRCRNVRACQAAADLSVHLRAVEADDLECEPYCLIGAKILFPFRQEYPKRAWAPFVPVPTMSCAPSAGTVVTFAGLVGS